MTHRRIALVGCVCLVTGCLGEPQPPLSAADVAVDRGGGGQGGVVVDPVPDGGGDDGIAPGDPPDGAGGMGGMGGAGGMGCGPERCDGLDDDCDGRTDEGLPGVGEGCSAGIGACRAVGALRCFADEQGVWAVACDAQPEAPGDERCNAIDDDCDGAVDEQVDGVGMPCEAGVGACRASGVSVCPPADGTGAEVELGCDAEPGPPQPEICNGLDDDCDGEVDEQTPGAGAPCVAGVGACAADGLTVCEPVELGVEAAARCDAVPGAPADEVCDGIDDDCDGALDEQIPGLGDACAVGVGGCNGVGRLVCRAEAGSGVARELLCDAIAGMPGPEQCNGLDDDCDGVVDDGTGGGACQTGRPGPCGPGDLVCENGRQSCVGRVSPAPELCNGIDDDCDGVVDDGVQNPVCGGCGPFPAEGCNGADDDCDGRIDEGLGGCGFALNCGVFTVRDGEAGRRAFPAVAAAYGARVARLIAVQTYQPEGDQQFEYRLEAAGADLVYSAGRGNGRSYVSGLLCSLGYGGTAGVASRTARVTGAGDRSVDLPAVAVVGPDQDGVAFPLVWDYTTASDDDYWYAATVSNPGGAGRGTLSTRATNLAAPQAQATFWHLAGARVRLESTAFDVRVDAGDPTLVDVPAPAGYTRWLTPIISVGRMQTGGDDGGDDDVWFETGCAAFGASWRCTISAGAAERDTARIAGQIISFWAPR